MAAQRSQADDPVRKNIVELDIKAYFSYFV